MSQATAAGARMCQGTFFVTQVARKSLAEKKEPSLLEQTSFLLDFGEHCDNFRKN